MQQPKKRPLPVHSPYRYLPMLTREAPAEVAVLTREGLDDVAVVAGEVHAFIVRTPRSAATPASGRPQDAASDNGPWALLPLLLQGSEHRRLVAARPSTRPAHAGADLYLDAVHDGELLLVAVSRGCPIGAGLQAGPTGADEYALATLSPRERSVIEQTRAEQWPGLLARLWVRKDAVLRLCGGRATAAARLDVALPTGHGRVTAPAGSGDTAVEVRDISPTPGVYAAVALPDEPSEVRVWEVDYGSAIANHPSTLIAGTTPLDMNSARSRHALAAGR